MDGKTKIYVNQVGYPENSVKTAYLESDIDFTGKKFTVMDSQDTVIFEGEIPESNEDDQAGKGWYKLDFSSVTAPGSYHLEIDSHKSYVFSISNKVWNPLFQATLEYFTNSRCGVQKSHTIWNPSTCHTGPARIYGTNQFIEADGGWHDAGDYGRYIVAGCKAVMDLLLTYKAQNDYKGFDILDEVRFELEWMMKLQREDGAVYHKISCYNFCGFIMPSEEKDPLVLAPVSTTATATFAGTLTYACQFYPQDKAFVAEMKKCADKAINFLLNNDVLYYENPPEISTGSYGDKNVEDELYFAYIVYGLYNNKKDIFEIGKAYFDKAKFHGYAWGFFAGYANEIVLENEENIEDASYVSDIKDAVVLTAEKAMEIAEKSPVDYVLPWAFWGCSGAVMDTAHTLILAYRITVDSKYLELAEKAVSYILGANPSGYCYVSGFGSNPMCHPHHRPSGFLKQTMPGMLAGGPCSHLIDEEAKKYLQGRVPLKCYLDSYGSYSTNEVAIYWNSALTLVLAMLMEENCI